MEERKVLSDAVCRAERETAECLDGLKYFAPCTAKDESPFPYRLTLVVGLLGKDCFYDFSHDNQFLNDLTTALEALRSRQTAEFDEPRRRSVKRCR